jgi:tetratricopeptide (TPR) repeat protein
MFGLFNKTKISNDDEAVTSLMRISSMGFGSEDDFKKENMLKVLGEVEGYVHNLQNPKIAYWLGIAWRNFTAWHIRGDERKEYLEKAVFYFDKALSLAKNTLPVQLPLDKRHNSDYLDQIDIAGDLGDILVNEALIRDLDRAERVLQLVFDGTEEYEPCLCAYAELFYKRGDYQKCAEIGLNISDRCAKSPEWKDNPPPAPLGIVGSAYRALAKQAKKEGKAEEAIGLFQKMKELKLASNNDLRILDRLKTTN